MSSPKPIIFISYAHADEPEKPRGEEIQWLSFVMRFLRPAVKSGAFTMWVDRQMPGGTEWDDEIDRELRSCDVFVLLVSASSMGSDYIIDKELEIARTRRTAGELYVYPLLIRPTPRAGLDRVREFNLRPRDAKPFSSYSLNDLEQHMSDAADEIADVAEEIEKRKAEASAEQVQIAKLAETARIAAETTGRRGALPLSVEIEGIAPVERAAAPPVQVAISGLPETYYQRLVGRDAELQRLDEAWSDDKTNILSLVAEGGGGKSALVNEWLTRLQAENYRGADCVLGWSFYSQGSKERATAADEFLNWALAKLGVKLESTSATAKGEAIAEALMARRALLVLDGVEPLQHGPGPQTGQLKDQGLRALLRRFAAAPPRADHGLIVLTSRLAVADLQRFRSGPAPVVDVERLSDEAGAELLRDNDVWGIDKELRQASRDFGGHPLALTLLASLVKETLNGDARRRDHIRGLLADADNPRHEQARRVMESYEKEWLAGQPVLLAILYCIGLFDRPASGDCLKALRARPTIPGLTDALVGLDDDQWRHGVARLREARLLAPVDLSDPEALDAHPLVREWFGDRLRRTNEAAWKAAHSRLYDHLRDSTREGKTPTLAGFAPLYHAVAHGCRAGRQREALEEVFVNRICRVQSGSYYSLFTLGSLGSDLAAISWFFETPYSTPRAGLTELERSWLFTQAGYCLRGQGRLREALPTMRAGLQESERAEDWVGAAVAAANLSELELLLGDLAAAQLTAARAVELADRSGDTFQMLCRRTDLAHARASAGRRAEARELFANAEARERALWPHSPLLSSLRGYQYCDLLISEAEFADVCERAARTLEWEGMRQRKNRLNIAHDTLSSGRASLGRALSSDPPRAAVENVRAAARFLSNAVASHNATGQLNYVSGGLLARACFRRALGDWDGAARDLDEVQEIAEPGPMRLYLCDGALARARLALARREAFAPLKGLVEPSPPPPALPDAAKAVRLLEEARKELDAARKLIAECGYHRRHEELTELDAVVAGRRRFADLPPRV